MKIAFVAPRYHTNQASLVKFLLERGNHVSFFVSRIGQSEDHSSLKPTLLKLSFFSKIFKYFIRNPSTIFDYRYGLPSIKELINFKLNKFNLIIIRDPLNLVGLSYFFWAKMIGVKTILYIQREIHKNSYNFKENFERIFIEIFKAQCISPCIGNIKFKKYSKNINYIPFCLIINNYTKSWFLNNKINILSIGKFIDRKNHILLIQALSKIKVKNNFRLTIIGECSSIQHSNYLNEIKKLIKSNNLEVSVFENVAHKEISKFYKTHDLFVLPSINEPASISNLEAMAYGLPIITTDSNNTSCYTEHGENGFIVKSNNIEDLSEKLKFLINNKNKLIKFGKKSLDLVKQKHDPNFVYQKFFDNL